MHTLYDSDSFIVVTHLLPAGDAAEAAADAQPALVRHGFEIVDKRSGKEIYLDGSWAELFRQRLSQWQHEQPSQEEVEDTLAQYTELAQTRVTLH